MSPALAGFFNAGLGSRRALLSNRVVASEPENVMLPAAVFRSSALASSKSFIRGQTMIYIASPELSTQACKK